MNSQLSEIFERIDYSSLPIILIFGFSIVLIIWIWAAIKYFNLKKKTKYFSKIEMVGKDNSSNNTLQLDRSIVTMDDILNDCEELLNTIHSSNKSITAHLQKLTYNYDLIQSSSFRENDITIKLFLTKLLEIERKIKLQFRNLHLREEDLEAFFKDFKKSFSNNYNPFPETQILNNEIFDNTVVNKSKLANDISTESNQINDLTEINETGDTKTQPSVSDFSNKIYVDLDLRSMDGKIKAVKNSKYFLIGIQNDDFILKTDKEIIGDPAYINEINLAFDIVNPLEANSKPMKIDDSPIYIFNEALGLGKLKLKGKIRYQ